MIKLSVPDHLTQFEKISYDPLCAAYGDMLKKMPISITGESEFDFVHGMFGGNELKLCKRHCSQSRGFYTKGRGCIKKTTCGFFKYPMQKAVPDCIYKYAEAIYVLIECKCYCNDRSGDEVRNGFLQLIEYMRSYEQYYGLLVVFDLVNFDVANDIPSMDLINTFCNVGVCSCLASRRSFLGVVWMKILNGKIDSSQTLFLPPQLICHEDCVVTFKKARCNLS